MSKRNAGWKVIRTLTADEARAIRVRELRGAAAAHAEIGEAQHASTYAERADALQSGE
jgi:hypothetical protein